MYECRKCKDSHDDIQEMSDPQGDANLICLNCLDEDLSEQERDFLYNIRHLQKQRNFHAQEVGRLTPKGYAAPSHHGTYFDAKHRVSRYTNQLAEILHPGIRAARNQGSAWTTIRFRFKITHSTLKALRQHKLFKDVH